MITKSLKPYLYEIDTIIDEIKFGNTIVDRMNNWDQFEYTTLKLKCRDCTIMVFREDFEHFKNIVPNEKIKVLAKIWKNRVYHFKKLLSEN